MIFFMFISLFAQRKGSRSLALRLPCAAHKERPFRKVVPL